MTESTDDTQAQTLGLTRWVSVAFMVFGLLALWLLDKIITAVWSMFAEPNPTLATGASALIAAVGALAAYRHPKVNRLSYEIVGELAKVTWPQRKETTTSTIVVVIASIIAAVIIGAFDALWSTITDLIYKV